jgi:hypothetical protein
MLRRCTTLLYYYRSLGQIAMQLAVMGWKDEDHEAIRAVVEEILATDSDYEIDL